GVSERVETGQVEIERRTTRRDAVDAGAQRRRVAFDRARDRRRRHRAGVVVPELLDDRGAPVARSGRASRRIAALAWLETHVRFSLVVALVRWREARKKRLRAGEKAAEEKYRRFTGRRGAPNTGKAIEIAKEKTRVPNWA